MSQGPYNGPPASKSGGSNVLMIVLVVLLVLGLLCAGACGVCMYAVRQVGTELQKAGQAIGGGMMANLMQSSAQEAVRKNAEVKGKIGEPVNFGPIKNENMDFGANAGKVTFEFDATGPQGTATIHAEGAQSGEQWKVNVLQVRCSDGAVINIDPSTIPATPINAQPGPPAEPTPSITIPEMPEEPDTSLPTDTTDSTDSDDANK